MSAVADALRAAKANYAAAPSHASVGQPTEPGTCCMLTAFTGYNDDVLAAETALRQTIGGTSMVAFNAGHTTDEVLAKFNEAIAIAEASA